MTPLPYVNFGPHGTFTKSGDVHTTAADIDALMQHIREANVKKVALHFHGGLIDETKGIAIAEKMVAVYEGAKALPLTVVWETGAAETLRANLTEIHQTKLFQKILGWVLKKAAARMGIGVDSKGVGLEMTDAQIRLELQSARPFDGMHIGEGARGGGGPVTEANLPAIENEMAAELEIEMDADPEFRALIEDETQNATFRAAATKDAPGGRAVYSPLSAAWAAAKIAGRVILRYIRKRDHGFYPTVMEELLREYYIADFGEWGWTGMKNTAESMWHSNVGRAGDERYAGRYLLEGLSRVQGETGVVVDLIGHSAGSIAICHLLRVAEEEFATLKVRNVLFLAPAARSELFLKEIASKPHRMAAFRLFTMNDESESSDVLVPGIYTRSLLYFISGVLEGGNDEPLVGMQRYLSGAKPYNDTWHGEVRTFLGEKDRLVLSPSEDAALAGFRSRSLKHGDFDDDPTTRESLTSILSA